MTGTGEGPGIARLRDRWRTGSATLGGWVMSSDPLLAEELVRCGFDEVTAACEAAGVVAGMHTGDGLSAASDLRRGFRMVTVASEYGLVIAGGHRELEAARAAISG
jgi:4-hydroxy-2-oxoheptanedioate aldolase